MKTENHVRLYLLTNIKRTFPYMNDVYTKKSIDEYAARGP
jgi:hypothetical protein